MEASALEVVYPNHERIQELSSMIEQFSADQIKDALRKKEGEVYEIIGRRGNIIRANFENRHEIAKLNVLLGKLNNDEKEEIVNAVKTGSIEDPIKVGSLVEDERTELARYVNRCGISCSLEGDEVTGDEPDEKEVSVTIGEKRFWVSSGAAEKIGETLKKIEQLGCKLQVNYAKRHVVQFNEEQEQEYNEMQKEYIELLKVKDELLKDIS